MAQSNVTAAVLVPGDVAAPFGGLAQMVRIFLLLKGKFVPSRDCVTDNLGVRKLVYEVAEVLNLVVFDGTGSHRTKCKRKGCCVIDFSCHIILIPGPP